MSMTLKEMRDQSRIDADILKDVSFPDGRVNHMINQAQKYVQSQLNGLGMRKWEASEAFGTVTTATYGGVDVKTTPTPTSMLESPKSIKQIEIADSTTGEGIAKEINTDSFKDTADNTFMAPTITQGAFMRLDNLIYLLPSTVASGVVHYYKTVTELTVDSTESDIPTEFCEYVVRRTVSQIDKINGKVTDSMAQEKALSSDISEAYDKFVGKMNTEKASEVLQ